MHILFLFFDGLGLGEDDPERNPFARMRLPTLEGFTGGRRWLRGLPRIESERALFIPTDANLGVDGRPQSATGQAAIMTGLNVPQMINRHYGPKPTPEIMTIIRQHGLVRRLVDHGLTAGLFNAYPSEFLNTMARGVRLPSSIQAAMREAGVALLDGQSFLDQRALSVDFTGHLWRRFGANNDAATRVWRTQVNHDDTPVISAYEAGMLLASLAMEVDFAFFDHWLTDYLGHRGTMQQAHDLLATIDEMFAGLLSAWDDSRGLVVVTSDHGNFEDLDARGHTRNPVPTLIIGEGRQAFANGLTDLTGFAPAILHGLGVV